YSGQEPSSTEGRANRARMWRSSRQEKRDSWPIRHRRHQPRAGARLCARALRITVRRTLMFVRVCRYVVAVAALAGSAVALSGQTAAQPTNDAPNPYQSMESYFKLPEGRTWGSTSAVEIDKDGKSIWIAERCGQNSCLDRASGQMSPLDPILHFDASGKLIKSFGAGMLIFPHGIHVDRDGNVW